MRNTSSFLKLGCKIKIKILIFYALGKKLEQTTAFGIRTNQILMQFLNFKMTKKFIFDIL